MAQSLANLNSNLTLTASNLMNSSTYSLQFDDQYSDEDHLENWLSIPTKRNIKKHGWKKLYVVLKKNKSVILQFTKRQRLAGTVYDN